VAACREGDEHAWAALVDRYKRLIYSIPIKYGHSRDDAADIFQGVCLDLYAELPKLRDPGALPKWLMKVAAHKCMHARVAGAHERPGPDESGQHPVSPVPTMEAILVETEREQILRDALSRLKERCRRLVEMLFFEEPPRPYEVVAKSLGLALGSIGFIRGRCLDQLKRELEKGGF
jgi:RNA polymerase sigma factor (sigma-70 family)